MGRNNDALTAALQAYKLDSASPVVNDRLATAYLWLDENQKANELFNQGASYGFVNPLNPGYLNLLLREKRWDEARNAFSQLHPDKPLQQLLENLEQLGQPQHQTMLEDITRLAISSQTLMPRLELGWWTHLGNSAEAIKTLQKYQQQKKYIDVEFLFSSEAEGLRAHKDFFTVCRQMGLQDYWDNVQPADFLKPGIAANGIQSR